MPTPRTGPAVQAAPDGTLLETILEATDAAVLVADHDGTVLAHNRRFLEVLHMPEDDLVHGDLFTILSRAASWFRDPQAGIETLETLYQEAGTRSEATITLSDGRVLAWVSTPRRVEGALVGHVTTVHDITDQRLDEERLRAALALQEATMDATVDGILVVDLDGRVRSWNRSFQELWKIPGELAALGDDQALLAFVTDQLQDPEGFRARVEEIYETPEASTFDLLEFADGRIYERTSQPHEVQGEIVGRVWTFRDVTEARKAARLLRRQAKQARVKARISQELSASIRDPRSLMATATELVGQAMGGTCILRLLGSDRRSLVPLATFRANAPPPEGLPTVHLQAPDHDASSISSEVVATGRAVRITEEMVGESPAQDPRVRRELGPLAEDAEITSLLVAPLSFQGLTVGTLTVLREAPGSPSTPQDLAELRELADRTSIVLLNALLFQEVEEELESRAQAEARVRELNEELEDRVRERTRQLHLANQELESFSYSVSHDLQAPLQTVNGFAKLLLDQHAEDLGDEGARKLSRIRAASTRMERLIQALLDLARLTRYELDEQEIDLTDLATSICERRDAQDPARTVQWEVAAGLTTVGDPDLIEILLENLIGNAWKFTRDREPARIRVGARSIGGVPTFFVQDNGVGFEEGMADRIFQPFQRLHTEEAFEGTGIGLATVHRIVRRHGGRVWARGEVGEGATILFTL